VDGYGLKQSVFVGAILTDEKQYWFANRDFLKSRNCRNLNGYSFQLVARSGSSVIFFNAMKE
jgi:hypothetical protein